MSNSVFSKNLQALRKQQGVTQEQLASFLGVSAQAVSKWENGNYPEGDLLPKISEFFGVSISYLYGQEKERISVEQDFVEELQKIINNDSLDKDEKGENYLDKAIKMLWAIQISAWKNNKNYYDIQYAEKDVRTASVLTTEAGYSYLNLCKEKMFYTLIREPEDGFAKNLPDIYEMRQIFAFLGKKGVLEIIYYMLSHEAGEYVTSSSIADAIGMDVNETRKLLEEGGKYSQNGTPLFFCISILDKDKKDTAYGVNMSSVCLYISLFLNAEAIMKPPFGYTMQINSRDSAWFEKEAIANILKK